ncbi:MAG TPA: LLM class flavin-dependent oxidoreductase [Baekduia sp.]|nr:LLM class flavin-dependent oxidoreductase [Baekduia sp.]
MIPGLGVLLPTFDPLRTGDPPRVAEAARLAEDLGFHAVWAGDHLIAPAPVLDAPACLAAAAVVTERVALGFSVMLLGLRPVAWAAKQLATIDALAGPGRLRLGVGVGGEFPEEFAAAGVPHRRRGARLDDALDALPDLLAGRPVRRQGRTQAFDVAPLEPAPSAPPPLYVGGRSEAALARAARVADVYLPMWLTPGAVAERGERLAELAAAHGRPRPRLALLAGVHVDADRAAARAQAAAHLRGQYRLELDRVERWTALGSADEVAEQLQAHLDAGVDELVLMPYGGDALAQYERLADVGSRLTPSASPAAPIPEPGAPR